MTENQNQWTYTYDVRRGDTIATPWGDAFVRSAFPAPDGFYFGTSRGTIVVPEDSKVRVVKKRK